MFIYVNLNPSATYVYPSGSKSLVWVDILSVSLFGENVSSSTSILERSAFLHLVSDLFKSTSKMEQSGACLLLKTIWNRNENRRVIPKMLVCNEGISIIGSEDL